MPDYSKLPVLRNDSLIWQDTSGIPLPGTIVPCLLCTKPFLMPFYQGTADQVCPECWKTLKDTARLECKYCKVTICRLVPKVLDNGFYIRPRAVYHSDGCNICKGSDIKETKIVEITEWERNLRPKKLILPGSKYR